jgi:kynurenine formamidase
VSETVVFGGRRYEAFDLSQRFSNATSEIEPMPHTIEYAAHTEVAAATEEKFGIPAEAWPNGEVWAFERMTLTTHSGTHIDAPYHYAPKTSAGEPARTIENVPLQWVMSDGFLLEMIDIDRRAGITEADVRAELERIGYKPKENDVALVRTDTSKHYTEKGYDLLHPGLRRDATAWLVEHGVKLIGIDAWGIDRPMDIMAEEARAGDRAQLWESHKYGAEREYSQIEKLCNLDTIPRPFGFQVFAMPVLIEGASAGWARVVALIEIEAG